MKARINRELIEVSTFDSGSLGVASMIVHQFEKPGSYKALIKRNKKLVDEVNFVVDKESQNMQLNLDLSTKKKRGDYKFDCDCQTDKSQVIGLSPKGFMLFFVSSGSGYSVSVFDQNDRPSFDSTKLNKKDVFAITMLEPSKYSMENTLGSAKGEIQVTLKKDNLQKINELDSVNIKVNEKRFNPKSLEVTASQGVVFEIESAARVVIKKGSKRKRDIQPDVRWRKSVSL